MNYLQIICVLTIFLVKTAAPLQSSHFCNLTTHIHGNKLNHKCLSTHFPHYCGTNKCAKYETDCQDYDKTKRRLRSNSILFNTQIPLSLIIHAKNSLLNVIVEKFGEFQRSIRKCLPDKKYLIQNVCVSGQSCYQLVKRHKKPQLALLKRVNCLCPSHMSYRCGVNYCATNQDMCQVFTKQSAKDDINSCQNDYDLIE